MADLTIELSTLQQGADDTLGKIETALQAAVDAGNLPLVGNASKNWPEVTSALPSVEVYLLAFLRELRASGSRHASIAGDAP